MTFMLIMVIFTLAPGACLTVLLWPLAEAVPRWFIVALSFLVCPVFLLSCVGWIANPHAMLLILSGLVFVLASYFAWYFHARP